MKKFISLLLSLFMGFSALPPMMTHAQQAPSAPSSLLALASSGYEKYSHENIFSVQKPKDWTVNDSEPGRVDMTNDLALAQFLYFEGVDDSQQFISDFTEGITSTTDSVVTDLTPRAKASRLGKKKAFLKKFKYVFPDGTEVTSQTLFSQQGKYLFVVSFTAQKKDFNRLKGVFTKFQRTFATVTVKNLTYNDSLGRFSFQYARGWKVDPNPDPNQPQLLLYSPTYSQETGGTNIFVERIDGKATLGQNFTSSQVENQILSQYNDPLFQKVQKDPLGFQDTTVGSFTYRYIKVDSEVKGTLLTQVSFYRISSAGFIVVITYTAPPAELSKYAPDVDTILSSLRF